MNLFFLGLFVGGAVVYGVHFLKERERIEYDGREYDKNWYGLKGWLERKLYNLDREEQEWVKNHQHSLKRINAKFATKKLQKDYDIYKGWLQQIGKIILISGMLEEFWGKNTIREIVWKKRGWTIDDGKIEKK